MTLLELLERNGGQVSYHFAVAALGGGYAVDTQLVALEERSSVGVIENPATGLPDIITLIPREDAESKADRSEAA